MNAKHLLITSTFCGLVPSLLWNLTILDSLEILPFIGFSCVAFLAGPLLSVWIYKNLAVGLSRRQAIIAGTATGVAAAVPTLVLALPQLLQAPSQLLAYPGYLPIPSWFAVGYPILLDFLRAGAYILLGFLGGVIGGVLFATTQSTPSSIP